MPWQGLGSQRTANDGETPEVARMRTWFRLDAVVITGPGCLHRAGLGRLLLPHPPVINGLLRLGLPKESRRVLGQWHEFGHLQDIPLALIYAATMFGAAILNGHASPAEAIACLVSVMAAWEIFAELYVITSNRVPGQRHGSLGDLRRALRHHPCSPLLSFSLQRRGRLAA